MRCVFIGSIEISKRIYYSSIWKFILRVLSVMDFFINKSLFEINQKPVSQYSHFFKVAYKIDFTEMVKINSFKTET